MKKGEVLFLKGAAAFRSRVLLSFLSSRPIQIEDIRSNIGSDGIGLREYEIHFLRAVSQLTDGTSIEINESGTSVKIVPGIIIGGSLNFDCGVERPIGYFLEMLVPLCLFAKSRTSLTLTGITQSSPEAPSVDSIKMVNFGILRAWGVKESTLDIKIQKRGYSPNGGGQILFTSPLLPRAFEPQQLIDIGLVKKVRGIASCAKLSPSIVARVIDSSKMTLSKLLPDALIYSDARKGSEAGSSPGYSLTIVGESTSNSLIVAEGVANPGEIPEDLANRVTATFLSRTATIGWGDSSRQWFILLLATLSSEDASSIRLGPLTPFSVEFLKQLYLFFGISFRLKEDQDNGSVLATCIGIGFRNIAHRST